MDENTNQQSTTPLGNERRDNPGQTKIIENANGDSITPGMPEWTDDTSLEDIAKQYTGIGGKYNDLVENAADNVGDRQVQLVGNDFGATNPYMFNTYYEPASTSFASEMRKQGTQRAVEVGLDRAEKEAKKNAEDAQNRYNNAVAAAKAREEQRRKAQMHISETDMSKLPEGVTEQEILNYYKTGKMSEKEVRDKYTAAGTKQIQDKTNVDINWHALDKKGNNMRLPVSADTKSHFGITNEQWANMSKKERDAFWAREDVGNYWTRLYMVNYFKEFYGEKAGSNMAKSFNDLNERVDNVVKAVKSNDLDSLKTIDVDFAGVQINFTPDQEVEKIKKAIQETDKLSDSEKQKYIKTIEAKRLSSGGPNAFMQMWHEIESKQVRMENNRQLETWDPDHKWLKNGMQVDTTTYDDVWEIMKLFAETEENMGMSIGGSKSGILHYADVEPDSKQVYSHTSGTLMDTADSKQLDNMTTEVFGINVDSWKKMAKLESERPEDYEFLRDHASFVMAGGAGSFEQVENGDKKYFINGKYWSANDENSPISVGDFIFHTIDGTVNSEGDYSDPQLKEFISDYKKIYNGDLEASEENIKKLEANYNAYANRVARAMFLSNNYGTSVNENLYNVILALDGVSDDKLEFVNPSNPEAKMSVASIKDWFNSLSDDAKYNAYTTISRKARESRGVMILSDDKTGQLYDAGITQNGKNTIGKYNEKDSSSNMRVANQLEKLSNEDCLALAFYIDNGIKNGTISNSFMDNEGVDLSDSFFNGIYNGLKGAAQFFGSVAALGVGSLMPKDKEGLNDVMRWGGEVWKDMTTMSESDDWMHWSGQSAMNPYTQQMREQQRGNLNHMIDTTFNLDYFNVENTVDPNTGEVKDKNGNVISLDNTHYNHMDQGKAFFTGAAGMGGAIAEFVLETAVTSGMGKLLKVGAKGTSSLIRKGARAVATKSPAAASVIRASSKFVKTTAKFLTTPVSRTAIQSALQASHAASYLDDVARQYGDDLVRGIADGEIKTAKDVIDAVGETTKAANAIKGSADDVARATLKEAEKTAVDGLKNYADDAIEAVKKGETMVDDLAKGAAEQADDVSRKLTEKEAQTLLDNVKKSVSKIQNDYAIRYGLDVVADNVDDAARSLSQRILDKLDKALTNAHVFKGVNDSVRTLLKDNLVDAVSRAAVNGRLAAKTGMSVSRIANLSDDAASVLYGMLRASENSADDVAQYALRGVSRMQSVSADIVLKNVDFKKAAQKIVEASERLAVKGGELGLDDVFRIIATESSINPGNLLKALKRYDFVKDRIADWSRDIAQNYWTPELDEHFESHYVDFDTYLHSPEQWLWGAGFDLGVTGLTRLKNHGKLKFYESRIDKILGDVDLSTANKADRAKFRKQMVKLDNLRAKASKLNGKILDRKVSFEQVHDVADKAERAIKDQIDLMSNHVDITETADLIKMHSDEAIDEAKAVLAKGGFGSKRKYKQILADADQFNRMIVRGNDKLAMVQEASQALQQVSITRYLDIDTHSKTIHKLNGQQWGKTMSLAWKEITDENFAAKYGRTLGLKEDALGKAFDSRHTINFKDPAKTKAAYAAGQTLVYDTIFEKVRNVMGDSLTKSEYADLRIELNGIRDRMITAGNQMIDDGRKVRWNYMPTQALTWESEPGSMSAVRALWGWDYKGGIHMTPAGEIANPLLARDQWDFSNIISDFDNGQNTFKRKKGDREIKLEKVNNPGATIDEFKDVNYNWAGFDPAYACNAYLNSIDSARIIQPLLDPINGIVIKNPEMAKKVLHTSNIVLDNELVAIEKRYQERVDKEISKRSKAKAGSTSKASLERRATLITDLSGKKGVEKFAKPDVGNKVSAVQAKIDRATMQIRDKVYNSPAISALESMYSSRPELEGLSPEARKAYVVGKLNIAYTELGNDIAAVRSMYTDGGKVKKAYLDSNGNIKPQYTDVMGNLVPDAGTSGTYSNTYGTQYRTFVNQLAQNKSIKAEAFADNNARNIRFSDGSSINANAFEKHIYNVLATKQAIDLGARVDYFRTKLSPKEMTQLSISKRLQPIDLDSDNARYTLTKEARNILSTFYGDWDNYTNSYTIKNGSAKDKFFQNAISNAFDEAEANGGEINTYDFVQLVDKHIPDFIKDAGRNNDVNVKDFFESMSLLRTYENSGGTTESLLRDLDNALYAEKSAANPDAGKIKALSDTIAVINGTYEFDQRTINRASFNESLDFEIDESDFGDDSKLTVGDITADANTSGQVEGFSNLYIPKGVDENLIGKADNESAAGQPAQAGVSVETFKGYWTPADVAASKDKVFLFGDNIEDAKTGYRPTSTQAVIRGEENAIGIPTKKNRGTATSSYFTDADFDEFKTGVDNAITKAKESGKTIVLPEDGIGTGKAQLEKRAPKCFKYLQDQLNVLSSSFQAGTFEASTAGHKEFSALNAKFAPGTKIMGIDISGKTIEDVYQNTLKGSGKNKAPATDSILGKATADAEKKAGKALTKAEKEAISQRYYDRLWDIWGEQNPELKAQIENLPAGTKITDRFAKTGVSQANSLQRWVKPAQGQSDLATIKFSHLDDNRPDELHVVLMDDSKTVNKAKSTDGNILHTMARNKGDGTIEFHPKKFMEHYENVKSGKSGWNMSIDKKAKEAGSTNVDTPWSGKKMEWKEGTAKAREFISKNSPIDLSNEYGSKDSLAIWLQEGRNEAYRGGDGDEGVLKRWNSIPEEVRDKISEDRNFSRLWDHYSPSGAMSHLGIDFVYLPDVIDRTYADYLWKSSKGAGVADDALRKAKDVVTEVSKSPEDMLTWTLLHERGHDAPGGYGADIKYSGEGGKEAAANNWAYERFFDKTSPDYIAAHDAAVKILNSINTKPVKSGRMDFSYGKSAQPHISENTTFEAVKSGKRTSTTRLASQHADYWQDLKVGDIVEFKNKGNTDSVLVRVTKAPEWIDPTKMSDAEFKSLLQKEGWKQKAFDELITNKVKAGDKALQFEYELVNKPTQSTTISAPRYIAAHDAAVKILNGINTQNLTAEPQKVKVISGGQTGVDTIGLEVGKELGLETGGTAAPGFYRLPGEDQYTAKDMAAFGLKEIDPKLQAEMAKTRRQFYLPRTRQNVINSDGTVYFSSNTSSTGYASTKRFADASGKPFILNPTASQLREWMAANNVKTLNIAGSRGSHIDGNFSKHVKDVLSTALKDPIDYSSAQTATPRNIGTSIKNALDILHANTESDYGSRQATRNTKRDAFDSLKKEFDAIANKLDKAADGNKIYRGNDILLGASDNQYLAFANGDHNTPWLGDKNPGGVDNYTARQALIAGRDRSGGRSFGNIDFWTPEKINDFIKKNGITVDPQLQEQLDNYKVSYAEKSAIVNDPSSRGRVSDSKLSLQNSVPEYLASFNSTVDVNGNTKQAKSSFDLNQRSKYKSDSLNYHSEGERYKLGDQRVVREANKASQQLSNQIFSANDAIYGGLDDPNTLYDWEGTETVAAVDAEIDAAGDEVIEAALQKDKEYQELLAWRNKEASKKKVDKNKIKEIDEIIAARRNEVASDVDDDVQSARMSAMDDIENRGEKVEFTPDGTMPVKSSRKDKSAPTSLDDYEYDNGDVAPIFTARDEGVNNTPYVSFVDASKKYNISESLVDLNTEFYGNGDKDGFIDARNKLNKQLDDEMASVAMMFDTDVSAKITALKELDGAKDGEVADILKKAKQQANDIEDETVRKYVIKRLDDEIKFAEDNLKLTEKTKAKIAKAIAERDPEYRAALEAKRQSNMKPTGSQISAAVPNGSNPVFVNGNMTPDGHITLQQLVDARNEMKLSRKNGKNTLKSSVETKKVLNAMRKEMEYNGSTLITEGPARRQDTWILNLYKRIYDSAGAPLPKIPTFEDLENGFMEYKGKKIKLDLKLSEIYIDPKIASLGHTYWGEGNVGMIEKFYKAATAVSSFNKTIQDIQLAGGLGQYNAFTLRNAITMMWQDPIGGTRALFTNFRNARSNESVVQFYLKNHEKLLKMAIDTGDYSALNAFTNVINARDEVTGGSAIAELGHTIMDMPENIKKEGVIAGLWDTTSNTYKAIFNNPTFVRWAAIAKADMQLRNYDHATRFVNRIMAQYGLKDEDFANMEGGMGTKDRYIAHLAQMRTDRYWTPSKFVTSGGNADKYLQKQKRLSIQRTADSLRGMPQKKTLRQCLSDFFFAIGYKLQMNAHPVVGIGSIFTALPNNLRASNAIRKRTSFSVMTSRFAGRGDRNEALVMIGIAALAHAWNTHIGAPSAFEELFGDHGDEENGTHGIAQSLMNFQDFGKFWLPNTKDGTFDPTKRGASIDPFFSIFTLQNSAFRAANKAFFPNQIPINTQRTFYQEDNQNLIARLQGVSDELIGANLLSGYKAIYEVLNNSTYFGNNIWERKRLPDGSENPNYNPLRNLMASVAHIMNLEEVMLGDTTNRWVKGLDIDTKTWKDGEQVDSYSVGPKIGEAGKYNGRTGTVAGSGIIQHEYLSALKKANDGEYFDALTESMELPFKTRNYASRARTQLNTEVIAALRNAKKEYDNKVKSASPEEKDKAYAEFAKKAVNIMHDWSAKNDYALGPNDELTSAATKILVSFMADEYDDVTNRVQNRYDKIRQELKMADGDQFLFSKEAMEAAIADGMSDSEAAELHNKHLTALKEAQIKEYEARQALIKAKIDPSVFDTVDYINDDISAKSASFDKKTYAEILGKLEAPIGEFKNYKEMKAYYEARISEATTTKQKAKLANIYNEQVLDVITPYIEAGYGAAAFNNIYWDGDNLSNKLGPYIILPADKYYGGKYPRTNYLKDMLGIGYRDSKNLPSDKQVEEQLHKVAVSLSKGNISSASALVDNALVQLRKGYWHAAPADYEKLIRMRALLSSRSK